MTERHAEAIIKDIDDAIVQMELSWMGGAEHQLEKIASAREKLEAAKDEIRQVARISERENMSPEDFRCLFDCMIRLSPREAFE